MLEALEDPVELRLVQLLGLDQDLLADADLAEVMEQAGVLDLSQFLAAEVERREGRRVAAVDELGEGDGEVGDPLTVAAGGRLKEWTRSLKAPGSPSGPRPRLALINCTTPTTWPSGVRIGTVSIDRVS